MNLPTIIAVVVIAAVLVLVIRSMWKNRKKGGCSCGSCESCGACHSGDNRSGCGH